MAKLPDDVLKYFAAHGKRGGKKAAANMTAEARAARAKKAVAAREAKKNKPT